MGKQKINGDLELSGNLTDGTNSVSITNLLTGVPYITTAPEEANNSGNLIFVVLDAEPAERYFGYIYIITEPTSQE